MSLLLLFAGATTGQAPPAAPVVAAARQWRVRPRVTDWDVPDRQADWHVPTRRTEWE